MTFSTRIKFALNKMLAPLNLRLDTLKAEKLESGRIAYLDQMGLLDSELYGDFPNVDETTLESLADLLSRFSSKIERLASGHNDVGFDPSNTFFTTPDMQALYLMLQHCHPARLLEVGSGNSTRIARQAIIDGALTTRIRSIDPAPRVDIQDYSDEVIRSRLEDVEGDEVFSELNAGDILFIDSSHLVNVGNDVARLFCRVLPNLNNGVVVHVHDVFLPYEYPQDFAFAYPNWGEQYLLHSYLVHAQPTVLWPGYQLQKQRTDLIEALPFLQQGRAQSFWFRVRK